MTIGAISNQIDEVRMVYKTERQNLREEFSIALHSILVKLLHSHRLNAIKNEAWDRKKVTKRHNNKNAESEKAGNRLDLWS